MRQYNFKSGGKYYHRVNKATARRVFNAGGVVIMCACNLRPDSYWSPFVPIAENIAAFMESERAEYYIEDFKRLEMQGARYLELMGESYSNAVNKGFKTAVEGLAADMVREIRDTESGDYIDTAAFTA